MTIRENFFVRFGTKKYTTKAMASGDTDQISNALSNPEIDSSHIDGAVTSKKY